MKIGFNILICFLMIGCNFQSETDDNSITEEKNHIEYVDLSPAYIGLWVSEEYFAVLKETRSTKKASEMGIDDLYQISEDNSILRMTTHEGGANNILLMTTENEGLIFNSDTTESYAKVKFENNALYVDGATYIKAPDGENALNEFVNGAFIAGNYLLNKTEIAFKTDGIIEGLDGVQRFKLNLDYNDAGMEFDKIYFYYNGEEQARTYLYEFNSDTLIISKIDCKTEADDYDYCVEVEKGEVLYKFVKK